MSEVVIDVSEGAPGKKAKFVLTLHKKGWRGISGRVLTNNLHHFTNNRVRKFRIYTNKQAAWAE